MAKTRELLLAGTFLIAAAPIPHGMAAEPIPLIVAQAQLAPDAADKDKTKAQPKQQPPAAKGPPPAAKGPPPAAKGLPPTAPTGQPQRTQAPPPATKGPPPAAKSEQPPAAKGPPPAAKAPPPAGEPRRPAAREEQRPPGQPPRPAQIQPQPGQPVPGQPPRPAQVQPQPGQPVPGQPPRPAQVQPAQPQPPAAQGQPTGQPHPPAAQGQPTGQPQPPAAQGQPPQPQPPAAQGRPPQPTAGQPGPAAGQAQTPPPAPRPGPAAAVPPPPPQQAMPPAVTARGAFAAQPTGAQGQPLRRVEELRNERREERIGNQIFIREPDRVIIREGDRTIIRHNEANRFLMGGREVSADRRGAETTTIVERPDGTRIITVTDDNGRLIRRVRRLGDGREIVIIDNRDSWRSGDTYFVDLPPPVVRIPRERYIVEAERASPEIIYETLMAPPVERIDRRYTLEQVRYSQPLRERMSRIDIDTITFEFGSWEIAPDQIGRLAVIADAINRAIARNPSEVFLIEGHTDAVGSDVDNLSLSDRRAESAALALTEQFRVPAENLTTQGYGEQYLKIPTQAAERANRRVTMRRITPLLTGQNQSTGQAN